MKGVVYTKAGGLGALEIKDIPKPVPRGNQVLIEVKASTLTGIDMMKKSGVRGVEVAGIVSEIGGNVSRVKVGDKVFAATAHNKGGWAEFALADGNVTGQMPDNLTFEEASATYRQKNHAQGKVVIGMEF